MPQRTPRIVLVGSGSLATAIGLALREAGYLVPQVISRNRQASLRSALSLAADLGAKVTTAQAQIIADVIWFCVPDAAIASAAKSLHLAGPWKNLVALHSSGALTSDELQELRRRGAAVASIHPLMTFVKGSRPSLSGVSWALEGDAKAVRLGRRLIQDLRGHAFPLRKQDKAAYHAWGMFASPLLTALLAASERVARAAGIPPNQARRRMLPIVRQTVENYAALGARKGFSGPLVRGDVATIQKHLQALRTDPHIREIYRALATIALSDLPSRNRKKIKRLLSQE